MRIVSPLLKRVVYPTLARAGVFRRSAAGGLAVVTYHGVLPVGYRRVDPLLDGNLVTADTFRRQLRLLQANYNVISPADMLSWCDGRQELPLRAVLLTCDDGLLNNMTDMLPVLLEEGLHCLFFVTGASAYEERAMLWYEELYLILLRGLAGHFAISCRGIEIQGAFDTPEQRQALWWHLVKRLSRLDAESRKQLVQTIRFDWGLGTSWESDHSEDDPAFQRRFNLLTRTELLQLDSAGMSIGAHSLSHPMLSQTPAELLQAEIGDSRARLEAVLGKRVWAFAYPFGDAESVTPQVLRAAKEAGYEAAFLNFGGGLGTELPRYALPRVHVTAEMNRAEFEAHVAGFHASLQRRARGTQQYSVGTAPG